MFTTNGDAWKLQRTIASHGFSSKYLHRYVDNFLDLELTTRLIPLLTEAAKNKKVYDLQDLLKRFAFDNICMSSFGHDPGYLSPSLPNDRFSEAFDEAVMISEMRYRAIHPITWKLCRFFNIGYEKKLKEDIQIMQDFGRSVVKPVKERIISSKSEENKLRNILERLLKYDPNLTDKYLVDMVNATILAGRDTTSASLTWFFWVLHKNKRAEQEIVKEIETKRANNANIEHQHQHQQQHHDSFEEIKDMVYTHAALCESMRIYPPIAINFREATTDDVLPDGTKVTKGTSVGYVPYAMGRMEKLWGPDWAEFRPERWLKEEMDPVSGEKKWRFVPRDPYSFPVFHAGPRICLGKDMAFMQMKRVVTGVLERFRVVPVFEEGFEPVYVVSLTAIMQGGFPVRFEERK
ncbi:cytochrome P450 94A2-like [Silene latifolia]|uniref:cytochrome P450 94A2-like n=1 Tax=Silene latifolia TaxID=37657 RepID=UPI003D779ADF